MLNEATVTADNFKYICDFIKTKAAIALDDDKKYLVESRLMLVAKDEKISNVNELILKLRQNKATPDLIKKVVNTMTVNETSFYRDIHPFDALRLTIIPNLLKSRQAQKKINIWCCACSSGQEPYSIAMLLQEHFHAELAGWNVQILATDISSDILAKAQEGIYTQLEVNRGLPAVMLTKFFTRKGLAWQISQNIRDMISFKELNLVEQWPYMPTMDIVFLRNVLIYFDVDFKKKILMKAHEKMAKDGCLFLGGSETVINLASPFKEVKLERSYYHTPV